MPWKRVSRGGRASPIRRPPGSDGETMTALCVEFGILAQDRRTTMHSSGYKDFGVHGSTDRSRRPYRQAEQTL